MYHQTNERRNGNLMSQKQRTKTEQDERTWANLNPCRQCQICNCTRKLAQVLVAVKSGLDSVNNKQALEVWGVEIPKVGHIIKEVDASSTNNRTSQPYIQQCNGPGSWVNVRRWLRKTIKLLFRICGCLLLLQIGHQTNSVFTGRRSFFTTVECVGGRFSLALPSLALLATLFRWRWWRYNGQDLINS